MKSIKILAVMALAMFVLAGCGQRVEVPAASVMKLMTSNGYQEGVTPTSTVRINRLRACAFVVCDKPVILDVSDRTQKEEFQLHMPKDRLNLDFRLGFTYSIDSRQVETLFNRVQPREHGNGYMIPRHTIYQTYVQPIIRSQTRSFMTNYSIEEIAANRDLIGMQLFEHLKEIIDAQTPVTLIYAELDEVDYPSLIVSAQERAAERREEIAQEEAALDVARVRHNRLFEEQQLQRAIEVERAEAEAEVNRILAASVTESYVTYRMLDALDKISLSDNTKFVPVEMLSSMAGQVMLGNENR